MAFSGFGRAIIAFLWLAPLAFLYRRICWLVVFNAKTNGDSAELVLLRSKNLKTGDLVLLGSYKHVSQQISGWSMSPFSHSGIVVKIGDTLGMYQADPNQHKTKCLLCGSTSNGVHIFPLEHYLKDSHIARVYRPKSYDPRILRHQLLKDAKHHCRVKTEFTYDPLLLLRSVFGWSFANFPRPLSRFCSQLVVEAYRLPLDPACCTPGMLLDHVEQNQWERV